ncbi:hypothetical protein [Phyllobacterium leguminum]|uniref:Uncharacterized protein n=1 Tax=Phyllobacterium leguminum TaxID=314237 RepID=A0A318T9U2_9HYPH|nr:hypothetical protein [Phyllobacterium leguminum]PYE89649.1 hypothetical protein C7477_103157 [Phyllobacterium leguminum]
MQTLKPSAAEIIRVITDLRNAILIDDDEGLAEHAEPMIAAKELIERLTPAAPTSTPVADNPAPADKGGLVTVAWEASSRIRSRRDVPWSEWDDWKSCSKTERRGASSDDLYERRVRALTPLAEAEREIVARDEDKHKLFTEALEWRWQSQCAEARVKELEAENAALRRQDDLAVAKLAEAMRVTEPFATILSGFDTDEFNAGNFDYQSIVPFLNGMDHSITIGHLRAARDFRKKMEGGDACK